jgi:hypothetical protein
MRNNHGRKERALFQFCLPTTEPEFPTFLTNRVDAQQQALADPIVAANPSLSWQTVVVFLPQKPNSGALNCQNFDDSPQT